MALKIRKGSNRVERALVNELNRLRDLSVGANFHASATAAGAPTGDPPVVTTLQVTAANASDLATSLTLVNNIRSVLVEHFADTFAHNTALSGAIAALPATDLASAITLANEEKADYNTHRTAASVHFTNDATNATAAADASDQSTLNTLLNELKTDINAHIAGALAGQHIQLIPA
jgi:hypothetical protein